MLVPLTLFSLAVANPTSGKKPEPPVTPGSVHIQLMDAEDLVFEFDDALDVPAPDYDHVFDIAADYSELEQGLIDDFDVLSVGAPTPSSPAGIRALSFFDPFGICSDMLELRAINRAVYGQLQPINTSCAFGGNPFGVTWTASQQTALNQVVHELQTQCIVLGSMYTTAGCTRLAPWPGC